MSQLPKANTDQPGSGQAQTVFYTGTNPLAVVVTRTASRMRKKEMPFATAVAALEWCQRHSATFVWTPLNPAGN